MQEIASYIAAEHMGTSVEDPEAHAVAEDPRMPVPYSSAIGRSEALGDYLCGTQPRVADRPEAALVLHHH